MMTMLSKQWVVASRPEAEVLPDGLVVAGADAQVIFMGDATADPVKQLLESSLNGRRFSDVSQPDQLWSILKQY